MKQCRICGEFKPRDEFHAHPNTADRLDGRCIPCYREYKRKHRQKPEVKALRREAYLREMAIPGAREADRKRVLADRISREAWDPMYSAVVKRRVMLIQRAKRFR